MKSTMGNRHAFPGFGQAGFTLFAMRCLLVVTTSPWYPIFMWLRLERREGKLIGLTSTSRKWKLEVNRCLRETCCGEESFGVVLRQTGLSVQPAQERKLRDFNIRVVRRRHNFAKSEDVVREITRS